jgi:Ice-binding-like
MRRVVFKARFLWIVLLAMIVGGWPMAAQAAPVPVTANSFAVLAGGALTCTNSSVTGLVGMSSSAIAVTLNPPRCNLNVQPAPDAFADFSHQYTGFAALHACPPGTTLLSTLTGVTSLGPGNYCTDAALTLGTPLPGPAGTLNLTGAGPWNFVIAAALTVNNFNVVMANGGNPCNVKWWVGAAATFNPQTSFQGTILGAGAITFTGTTLTGRAWANGAVTMTTTNILGCTAAGTVPGTKCKPGTSNDEDENAEQSKDTGDSNKSVSSAAAGASQSSKDDGKDENGKQDNDKGNKGCNSDNSNHGDKQSKDS